MTTEPSPYEQGFRDALLSVKSTWLDLEKRMSESGDLVVCYQNLIGAFEMRINQLIDQKNYDLWSLLALAQASVPPEAQALRDHLRAPSGVLIDSAGRMLFLRLNGTEYDTGVLGLLSENAELKQRVDLLQSGLRDAAGTTEESLLVQIIVNSVTMSVYGHVPVSFETLLKLSKRPDADTVTWRARERLGVGFQGSLLPGQSVPATEGMIFSVARTSSA
jgi:hypothetical protein